MLSGFMVGSTQWLLYITAAGWLPLVIISLLVLFRSPSLKTAIQFAVLYTLMFTSTYAALNIISTYGLVIFVFLHFAFSKQARAARLRQARFLALSSVIICLLCLPSALFTLEVLQHTGRGHTITNDPGFFNSNYLHPMALSSLVFPFSSVKMAYANTEGTMLNTYMGLFSLIALPLAVLFSARGKNKPAIALLAGAAFFLLISFGSFTPLRQALNTLPGFSYFRHPAIFRFYFILLAVLFLATALRNRSFIDILRGKPARMLFYILAALSLIFLIINIKEFPQISEGPAHLIKNIQQPGTMAISALIQVMILALLLAAIHFKIWRLALYILILDLVVNTLVCTPFFSVSSYSLPQVNSILHSRPGFPVQEKDPVMVAATFADEKGNTWQNTNVFSKEVSTADSYRGPLELVNSITKDSSLLRGRKIVYASDPGHVNNISVQLQDPAHVRVFADLKSAGVITLQQNYFRGWKVFVNGKRENLLLCYTPKDSSKIISPGISVQAPAGKSEIEFRYSRKDVIYYAVFLHLFMICWFVFKLYSSRKTFNRSSSLS
jgi:hypothetical protein